MDTKFINVGASYINVETISSASIVKTSSGKYMVAFKTKDSTQISKVWKDSPEEAQTTFSHIVEAINAGDDYLVLSKRLVMPINDIGSVSIYDGEKAGVFLIDRDDPDRPFHILRPSDTTPAEYKAEVENLLSIIGG